MCNPVSTERPDDLLVKGVHRGFEWEIVHNGMGQRCGYVRIPLGHPWHCKDYDDIDPDVHGGLTFAAADTLCNRGGKDNAWWLGFDCGHFMDAHDFSLPWTRMADTDVQTQDCFRDWMRQRDALAPPTATVKDNAYVQRECESLIDQALAIGIAT